jgi:hypothetical protein
MPLRNWLNSCHAAFTGAVPGRDPAGCVVHAAGGPSPLDSLPYRYGKPLPGCFRLGPDPGLVKREGSQTALW